MSASKWSSINKTLKNITMITVVNPLFCHHWRRLCEQEYYECMSLWFFQWFVIHSHYQHGDLDNFKHMQFLIKLDVLLCIYFIIKQCTYKIIHLKMIGFFSLRRYNIFLIFSHGVRSDLKPEVVRHLSKVANVSRNEHKPMTSSYSFFI